MITEDYASFEIAKLLKEKGFDWDCQYCYIDEDDSDKEQLEVPTGYDAEIDAPTLQMAMKWLREVHNLHIITLPYAPFDRHSYHPDFEADKVYIAQLFRGIIPIDGIGRSVIKLTHEEACEAAIKYCLENLI